MPNIKSAKKRVKVIEKKTLRNNMIKSAYKTAIKKFEQAIEAGNMEEAKKYATTKVWTRCIWDVTAVAWLLNDNERFMKSRIVPTPIPTYDNYYAVNNNGLPMRYVYYIDRDALMNDLINKLT